MLTGSRFILGRVVCTPDAVRLLASLPRQGFDLLERHASGDWGDVTPDDAAANASALQEGERILSSYVLPSGEKLWVLTEADRSCTTILTPDEY
jgi:hypothetical protein